MQRALLLVLLIAILAVGGYFLLKSQSQEPAETTNTNELSDVEPKNTDEKTPLTTEESTEVTVLYGSNGYSPATVTIKQGQKVTFKNESGKQMWVASDDHPSHLIYQEFDAKTGIATGSSYEFVFDKVGTWRYHDHLMPSRTGIVIVE